MQHQTYKKLCEQVPWEPETFDIVNTVEAHRSFWQPKQVKVLLLAESHVYTSAEDYSSNINLNVLNSPKEYVRLVYCLGYGENKILNKPLRPNTGTPQFWKIFYSCLHHTSDHSPILKTKTTLPDRIQTKIDVLNELKNRGIWLLDASPLAICSKTPHGKPSPRISQQLLSESWKHYTWPIIRECDPHYIICIGKAVWNVIGTELTTQFQNRCCVVPQPQARLSKQEIQSVHQLYYNICQQYAP